MLFWPHRCAEALTSTIAALGAAPVLLVAYEERVEAQEQAMLSTIAAGVDRGGLAALSAAEYEVAEELLRTEDLSPESQVSHNTSLPRHCHVTATSLPRH